MDDILRRVHLTKNDWATLQRLRDTYLTPEKTGGGDYWTCPRDLELYDATFGQRIAWKWENVLRESKAALQTLLTQQKWRVMDWGCGTGIAARTLMSEFPDAQISELTLFDRSGLAREFAKQKIKTERADIPISDKGPAPQLLLVSHALGELNPEGIRSLLSTIKAADAFIWVEPGTKRLGKKLVEMREELKSEYSFLAPCPHSQTCGLLTAENQTHWCHHFAQSPDEIFHSAFWREFSNQLGIDLRSLPVSYLVGTKASLPEKSAIRILGKARIYNGYTMALCCERSEVADRKLLNKQNPELNKSLKRPHFSQWISSKLPT